MLDYFELCSLIERLAQKQVYINLKVDVGQSRILVIIDGDTLIRATTNLSLEKLRELKKTYDNKHKETSLKEHKKDYYFTINF